MAGIVRWSELARDDLADAAGYIARDSVHYAEMFIDDVLDAAEGLCEFPRLGHVVPEFDRPAIRELPVRGYRMIYEVASEGVVILALVHGARELESLWRRQHRPLP